MDLFAFANEVMKRAEDLKESLNGAFKQTAYDIGDNLVWYTPIDTGLASSNWSLSSTGTYYPEREPSTSVKGEPSLKAFEGALGGIKVGDTLYYTNPVRYIGDLENGTSPQAPAGMKTPVKRLIPDLWKNNLVKYGVIK